MKLVSLEHRVTLAVREEMEIEEQMVIQDNLD